MKRPDGIILSVLGYKLTSEESVFFKRTNPLGFVLFSRNFKNKAQISNLVKSLKLITKNKSVLIFIDQEGGKVQRLKNKEFTKFPPQSVFGDVYKSNKSESKKLSYLTAYLLAYELKLVGIDINFSPVCDLFFDFADSIIGNRSFGNNPKMVKELVAQYCKGFRNAAILPVLKHFPGHGRSLVDTHKHPSIINTDIETLFKADFIPFSNLKNQSLLMLAHIVFQKIDKNVATFSKKINQLIRKEFLFKGLIITDDISMKALNENLIEITKKSYNAGCDVVLHCNGNLSEMKKIYPHVRVLKKKYYDFFLNDILKLKIKNYNIPDLKKLLSSNCLIKV